MDIDIEFGELEESTPDVQLRPDQNKHFAIVAVDSPEGEDVPIYVDVDAMRDMELHALSDTGVELGGVLLGGQYEDEGGSAFVVVTDSLRAKHYESTKGSFKFTHETWAEITKERDEFPEQLQMVGWYHTHPDWGVFLSGMDMFICDNFFNRTLDVALVIDPCRGDRGMFQWTGDPGERIRRTGGFYLMASRFRGQELAMYAAQLRGPLTMADPRLTPGLMPAPVVNISDNRSWQTMAVLGMLTMQFCLLLLFAWKMFGLSGEPTSAERDKQLVALGKKIDGLADLNRRDAEAALEAKVMDRVVQAVADGPNGFSKTIRNQQTELETLKTDLYGHIARVKELERERGKSKLDHARYVAEKKRQISQLDANMEELKADRKSRTDRIAVLMTEIKKLNPEFESEKSDGDGQAAMEAPFYVRYRLWLAIGLGAIVAVAFMVVMMTTIRREDQEVTDEMGEELKEPTPPANYDDEKPES